MRKLIFTAAAAAAVLASPAFAEPEAHIRAADLDLTTQAGQAALDGRIVRAARRLCAEPGTLGAGTIAIETECRAEAMRAAAAQRDALIGRATLAGNSAGSSIRAAR